MLEYHVYAAILILVIVFLLVDLEDEMDLD